MQHTVKTVVVVFTVKVTIDRLTIPTSTSQYFAGNEVAD
jgi:hypothetical protein